MIGEYRIGLKFNDEHVPDSPFKVYISPAVGDAHLLEVAQFPEGSIQADKPSQFIVRRNGAKGDLDAKVKQVNTGVDLNLIPNPIEMFTAFQNYAMQPRKIKKITVKIILRHPQSRRYQRKT